MIKDDIQERKEILSLIKKELIQRLNLKREEHQIDDDTALFGNGLKLDSVDATEILIMLDKVFGVQVAEGDEPDFMRTINSMASFIQKKKNKN